MKSTTTTALALLVLGTLVSGCATKKYTRAEVSASEARVTERVDGQVADLESQVETNQNRIRENSEGVQQASKTAQDALDRAIAAGKLAEGKLLYETVLSNDDVRFSLEKAEITEEAESVLDEFVAKLKQDNENVFVEIQGHTDATGDETYNMTLGEERGEAVRRYLSRQGVPLHRMSVISYGESEPVADNSTREGRAQNRRVVLVVLK